MENTHTGVSDAQAQQDLVDQSEAQQAQQDLVKEAAAQPGVAEAMEAFRAVEQYAVVTATPEAGFSYATGGNPTAPATPHSS